MDTEQINNIKELAEPIVEQEDLFVVDVEEKGSDETVLWIYVDSEKDDVSVESCTKISRELGFVIEAHEVVQSRYRLNVSSPGLSRPLTDLRQYRKNQGRITRIKFKSSEGYEKLEGVLKEVSDNIVEVEVDKNETRKIPFDSIVETKIIPKI
ncbi:MAG: ribosome maturation factor [Balneolaceae bacterium]